MELEYDSLQGLVSGARTHLSLPAVVVDRWRIPRVDRCSVGMDDLFQSLVVYREIEILHARMFVEYPDEDAAMSKERVQASKTYHRKLNTYLETKNLPKPKLFENEKHSDIKKIRNNFFSKIET